MTALTPSIQPKLGIKDIYKFYKTTQTSKPVDVATFNRVWSTFIEEVIRSIILTGKDFNMPSLGAIGIRKQKVVVKMTEDGQIDKRYLAPDWKKTKELWARDAEAKKNKQLVFHLNKHFNGFKCKWSWDKSTCSMVNNTAYSMMLSRANKRLLSKVIQDEDIEVDYHEQRPNPNKYERKGRNFQEHR